MSQRIHLFKNIFSHISVSVQSTVVDSHWIVSKLIVNVYVCVPAFEHLGIKERKVSYGNTSV